MQTFTPSAVLSHPSKTDGEILGSTDCQRQSDGSKEVARAPYRAVVAEQREDVKQAGTDFHKLKQIDNSPKETSLHHLFSSLIPYMDIVNRIEQ
ncbi:uncharacterized protein V6R79_005488 [Siganus canaliculatus]